MQWNDGLSPTMTQAEPRGRSTNLTGKTIGEAILNG